MICLQGQLLFIYFSRYDSNNSNDQGEAEQKMEIRKEINHNQSHGDQN